MTKIIGLIGAAGSGKDTVAQLLGYKKLSFAGTVKDVASVAFDWDRELLEGLTPESRAFRETVDEYWGVTPRLAMQKIGTEMFRDLISKDFWLKRLRKEIEKAGDTPVVITDCRFQNEADFIRELGGTIVYIKRDVAEEKVPLWAREIAKKYKLSTQPDTISEYQLRSTGVHISELAFYGITPDVTIENNGTLEDLKSTCLKINK